MHVLHNVKRKKWNILVYEPYTDAVLIVYILEPSTPSSSSRLCIVQYEPVINVSVICKYKMDTNIIKGDG